MEFGKKIANLRKMKKVTQMQLAEYLSVNPQTVSRWEAEGGTPDVTLLPKIASFFGISLDELFGMTDMEQINNLVYKYSVLRDEKSFEEVMRSIDIALDSLRGEMEGARTDVKEDIQQKMELLKSWKVHIYIQKSRGALEEAEKELNELRKELDLENPLYMPMKLQKQQFRIQMGETASIIKNVKTDWEKQKSFETLCYYMSALYDAQRSDVLLQLWEQDDVQKFVCEVNSENEGLWHMMFDSAYMERDLEFFERYHNQFRKSVSEQSVFEMEWTQVKLYKALHMDEEKTILKKLLQDKIKNLGFNEYIKDRYSKKIEEL